MPTRKVELLAPAKDLACGCAAIDHGADAVYVGAPRFGARATVGNSLQDIEKLCRHAHLYNAQVHVALNTILTDHELEEAGNIIRQLYEAGADALIIQDTGILQLDLPPIALHASTQTDNRTADKVKFWESIGFRRVILARELSLQQIREIRRQTSVELEAFVHGALCVSYSGQCYMSYACTQRSANRGECAQFCRLPYTLTDADGNLIRQQSHLLSLKDMNRSASIREMLDAGITSFKIEGRLKGIDYVKNITAFYRQTLDRILESDSALQRSSAGKTLLFFTPNIEKTFNRGGTDYFLHERTDVMVKPDTPKSIGEPLGKVLKINGKNLIINTEKEIHNGDGLGFVNSEGELCGVRVNKAEGTLLSTLEPIGNLKVGTMMYRNLDIEFSKMLSGKSAERKLLVDIRLSETESGFALALTDEEGVGISLPIHYQKEISQKGAAANEMLKQSLSKLGGTPFVARSIEIATQGFYFVPNSVANEWRREAVELLIQKRLEAHQRPTRSRIEQNGAKFPTQGDSMDYRGNIMNAMAREFYALHGVARATDAMEAGGPTDGVLMTCKHCIRHTLGYCSRQGKSLPYPDPLFISTGQHRFRLEFDCKKCEMTVHSTL